jgi:hypothetical protein
MKTMLDHLLEVATPAEHSFPRGKDDCDVCGVSREEYFVAGIMCRRPEPANVKRSSVAEISNWKTVVDGVAEAADPFEFEPDEADPGAGTFHHRPPSSPRVKTLSQFCDDWHMSRTKAYELINDGKLRTVLVGSRRMVLREDEEAFVSALPTALLSWPNSA